MEMEGGIINPDATLDYVEFHMFPSQNRFEAIAWSSNREENVASGPLEQLLLLDSPEIKTLSNKGSDTTFKILPPENVSDASWFTAATLTRFLHFIGLPDVLNIGKEISQLEETRNFQLSLFDKAEADITTSVESKNELLLAVDLRLTVLKKEVASTFNQVIGSKSSPKDISDTKNFGFHFGTKNLRDSLQNFVESITISTEDEEDSTVSSENDEPSVERSRGLTRSATPRRSASPMRRIQIGRSGSRRAASLSIKSLNYFPVKEKSTSHGEADVDSSEEDSQRPVKNNALRMSVQDKISLFESKQREQGVADVHKTKTSVGANKAVLRRWSSAIGEKAETHENSPKSVEPDSIINKTETCVGTSENVLLASETGASEQCRVEVDTPEPERDESREKNELFNELMESKPQKVTSDNNRNKSPKEQRGGLYDLYKKKREEKLQTEASRKIVEKEAKTTSGSTKVIGANRRLYAANELQKTQKNSSPLTSSRTKSSSVKKSTSKDSKPSPLPATRKSWPSTPSPARTQMAPTSTTSTPTNRKPQSASSASSIVRSGTKVENVQPKLKTPKAVQKDANMTVKAMNEKKQAKVTENKRMTKTADTTATAKPSIYNKVTKKSSVVPLETKPFLRKGSGTGPSVGPVIKTKMNKVATRINITSQNQEIEYEPSETRASVDLEPQVVSLSPTKREEPESSGDGGGGGGGSRAEVSEINTLITEELEIPPTAWVVGEEHQQDEIVSCKESPVQTSSPPNVETPAGFVRPRIRHSLSQMLLEDSNEVEIDEWGNAEHPPTMVYQKDAPRGLKRLLKFARKAKADSHLTAGGWSSPSAFSEGEDDIEESKGQSSLSRYSVQNHHRVPEGHVSASMNTTKATRSFFSLSAFRGNKTNETKLLQH
ncbi:hypothetical protein HanXRQr2_Chr14g0668081 [Helianthus annuus]|uniref:Uncharacterized protein n=1 Tax=Helianthus annuus TaxID=4232 RepID=A0A9K3EEN9_HELAN|nr:uncharacterized protein LOC110905003 isoform X1 [Helianthus annuus]XP_022006564.1 uncharacterized protein LOC110905003 isoform X1 [Helianthus annuus]XP_022006565.1 uncharacterized protein LOC110905003 isoform X1 [Helianthus annuus]XP_022006566.1 uncharacterized protein LOC110905003 isoform X1 [Helianthus annuus]KAF5771216.1 hypothetical protein HanXRQr2_Chr14g0668081 [Helianthus annuus]